jgi:hypothetical protein
VRAGAPPGADDWPDNSGLMEWHNESDILASETLGDATHAQLVFMLACHLLQRESLFEDANEDAIECGWPAMHTALASESWEIGVSVRDAITVFGGEAIEEHCNEHTRACTIAQKCFADAIKHVAASRAEDAALEARLHNSDLGVSVNTARGWLCFKQFAVHCNKWWNVSSVSAVSVNDSESSVAVEQCKAWVSWCAMIVAQIDRTGVG